MSIEVIAAGALTLMGGAVAALRLGRSGGSLLMVTDEVDEEQRRAALLLRVFVLLVLAFGLVTAARYWRLIWNNLDELFFAAWLALAMAAGMIIQVLAANYRARKRFLPLSAGRLIYPLLFSVIVFYPVWALAASAPRNFFVFHAAFLNGYFWESVVSATRPTEGQKPGRGGAAREARDAAGKRKA